MNEAVWLPSRPVDLPACLARHTRWGEDLVTVVRDGVLHRVGADGAPYRAHQDPDGSIVVSSPGDPARALTEVQYRLAETLPVDGVERVAASVPTVAAQLRRLPGYRPPMNRSMIESLVASICAQQVNLRWALTTRNRLVERYGTRVDDRGVIVWHFPTAEVLSAADPAEIRAMQFTQRKAEYIVGMAAALHGGALDGIEHDDDRTVIERITAIRGLGRWTAEWFLARTLARPSAIAAGDLGVRKAVSWFVADTDETLPEDEVRHLTSGWGDGGNWAVHLLLEKLADQ